MDEKEYLKIYDKVVRDNYIIPCKLCSEEAMASSGGEYCGQCYTEIITNHYINKYPVSGRELKEKFKKKGWVFRD